MSKTPKLSEELENLSGAIHSDGIYYYSDIIDKYVPRVQRLENIEIKLRAKRVELEGIRQKYFEALQNSKNIKNFGYDQVSDALGDIRRQLTLIEEVLNDEMS